MTYIRDQVNRNFEDLAHKLINVNEANAESVEELRVSIAKTDRKTNELVQ